MPGYVRGIEETIDLLSGLYDEGQAVEVAGLAEYALAAAERALKHIDDSDGQMGDVIGRLEELYLDACRRAGTDPVALAQRLFKRELKSDWGVFDCAVVRYADVLGDAGLARYRALADERWGEGAATRPGEQSRSYSGTRFSDHAHHGRLAGCPGASPIRSPYTNATWRAATASFGSPSCVARTATMT